MDRKYQEKLGKLSLLIQMAKKDGCLDDVEIEFFIRIAKRLKVAQADYEKVFRGEYVNVLPKYDFQRIPLFHSLLLMIYADGKIDDKEIHFCHELGIKLGLNSSAILDILNKLKEQPQVAIDPLRVKDIFKRYYN